MSGSAERPRVAIMVSNKNMYVQAIDDAAGVTLASVASKKDEKLNRGIKLVKDFTLNHMGNI